MWYWAKKNLISLLAIFYATVFTIALIFVFISNSTTKARVATMIEAITTKNRIDQHERDSLINVLQTQQFQEEYYINQLGIQSDWMILYTTLIFGIIGLIGFGFFRTHRDEVEKQIDSLDSRLSNSHASHKKQVEDDISDLKFKIESFQEEQVAKLKSHDEGVEKRLLDWETEILSLKSKLEDESKSALIREYKTFGRMFHNFGGLNKNMAHMTVFVISAANEYTKLLKFYEEGSQDYKKWEADVLGLCDSILLVLKEIGPEKAAYFKEEVLRFADPVNTIAKQIHNIIENGSVQIKEKIVIIKIKLDDLLKD